MTSTTFNVPSTIIHGGGARKTVAEQAKQLGAHRILLVTDDGMVKLGVAGQIRQLLENIGLDVAIFDQVHPDPTDQNVRDGLAVLRKHRSDVIVAVGGGSPIDTGKVISILQSNPEPMRQYMGYHQIPNTGLPLIAIPTTAGTGSEVTKVAVITDTENDVKMMMLSTMLLPRVALVDYELTMSMPHELTAAVGVDTLTHAIEAYVSTKANVMTDPIALSCIRLVARHLPTAWQNPTDRHARKGMMLAACQGGMSFSNSSVCLVHGMSRPIGAVFHLPHGLSNAVLLPTITQFSIAGATERYATVARTMGYAQGNQPDETAAEALVEGLQQLNYNLQVPRLGQCKGVNTDRFKNEVQKMAQDALASGSPQNNPRVPTEQEIIGLYHQAW